MPDSSPSWRLWHDEQRCEGPSVSQTRFVSGEGELAASRLFIRRVEVLPGALHCCGILIQDGAVVGGDLIIPAGLVLDVTLPLLTRPVIFDSPHTYR